MAVLVTGGAGYIGSITARALMEVGEQVVVLDDYSTGHSAIAELLPGIEFVKGDCTDPHQLRWVFTRRPAIDAVVHFAALTLVGESMERPTAYVRANFGGTLTLIEEMRAQHIPFFIFSSSAAVFGVAERLPIDEDHPQRPINPYGWSKRAIEEVLPYMRNVGGPAYIGLRYFNAAGASRDAMLGEVHEPETHLVPNLLKAAMAGEPFRVFGTDYPTHDGTCERDLIHVEDLAAAHVLGLQALRHGHAPGFYNLGNGRRVSIREAVRAAREVTGREIAVLESDRRPGDPPILVASSDRITREIGWTPKRQDLRVIIEDAWRFLQAHPDGY